MFYCAFISLSFRIVLSRILFVRASRIRGSITSIALKKVKGLEASLICIICEWRESEHVTPKFSLNLSWKLRRVTAKRRSYTIRIWVTLFPAVRMSRNINIKSRRKIRPTLFLKPQKKITKYRLECRRYMQIE